MPATHNKIATTTLSSANTIITFSSIPATYTDLRLVIVAKSDLTASDYNLFVTINTGGSTHARTRLIGNGTTASAARSSGDSKWNLIGGTGLKSTLSFSTLDIFSYTNSKYKFALSTWSGDYNGSGEATRQVNLWQNTAAINSLEISSDSGVQFDIGSTATLYGIKAAV